MKKVILTSVILFTALVVLSAQEKGIIAEVLRNSVEQKVDSMQMIIGFEDEIAKQLKELELKYLFGVQKAETCFLCNTKKRIKKLQRTRDEKLQKILPRDLYIKYHSIENNLLNENNRLWLH